MVMLKERIENDLFDETPELDDLYGFELQDNLSEEETDLAMKIVKWGLLRGVAIVTGPVGSGKDLFGNTISWLVKHCFKDRKALRDEKPRRLYGYYDPITITTITQDLMDAMPEEPGRSDKLRARLTTIANQWLESGGEEKLTNGVLFKTEFWRDMHNREPFSPMGILMGAILKRWRHLNLLVIGNAPKKHELDKFSCLPYITHEVRASWLGNNTGKYRVFRTTYTGAAGVLKVTGKAISIKIDGGKPRDFLGGRRFFDLFNSTSRQSPQGGNL